MQALTVTKYLTLKSKSQSIKQAAVYFGKSDYLFKQAMKQKQSYGILSKLIILGRNKISDYTKNAVLSLYEDDDDVMMMMMIFYSCLITLLSICIVQYCEA